MKNDRNKTNEEKNNIDSHLRFYDLYFINFLYPCFRDLYIFYRNNLPFFKPLLRVDFQARSVTPLGEFKGNGFNKMNEQRWFILIAIFIVLVFVGATLLIAKIGIFLEKSFFG